MRVGICAYDMAATELVQLAIAADELGFEMLWLGEHILLPVGFATEHPTTGTSSHQHKPGAIVKPDTELLDPLVELAAVAGATSRLRLATGMYILPLRHPLLTARAACTVQQVSGGRLLLGVGTGWLEEEFTALDIPFAHRVARFEETVEIMRLGWAGGPFSYAGSQFQLGPVQITPHPVDVPVIFGGNGPKALRRAAEHADGWFASGTPSFDEACRLRDQVATLRASGPHREPEGGFRCYVRVDEWDDGGLQRYGAEGLEDVAIWADQVWVAGDDVEINRTRLAAAADRIGVRRPDRARA